MSFETRADVIALVMAAGEGRRFGSDKRRHRLADGRTLLATTLAAIGPAYRKVYVLVRPGETLTSLGVAGAMMSGDTTPRRAMSDSQFDCLEAPTATKGLGGTLGDGFRHLREMDEPATAAAVILADMPWLDVPLCQHLNDAARADRIVVPTHADRGGHPVVFGRHFWPSLATLTGGEGARHVVARHRQARHWVAVETPNIWRDVDRRDDLV